VKVENSWYYQMQCQMACTGVRRTKLVLGTSPPPPNAREEVIRRLPIIDIQSFDIYYDETFFHEKILMPLKERYFEKHLLFLQSNFVTIMETLNKIKSMKR
jgi:hypothetical protein